MKWFKVEEETGQPKETKDHSLIENKQKKEGELEEARMIYHYANKEFETKRKSANTDTDKLTDITPSENKVNESQGDDHVEVHPTFFKGTFKASVIPSPVHGILKQEEKHENSDYDWLIAQTKESQAAFADRHFKRSSEPLPSQLPAYQPKDSKQLEDDAVEIMRPDRSLAEFASNHVVQEEESSGTENEVEEKQTKATSQLDATDSASALTKKQSVDDELISHSPSKDDESTHEKETDILLEQKIKQEDQIKNDEQIEQVESDVVIEQELIKPTNVVESNRTERKESKQKQELSKASIPFNVLMLPKDKPKKQEEKKVKKDTYDRPPIHLLNIPHKTEDDDTIWLDQQAQLLEETLASFHVDAKVIDRTKGPAVTRFEIQPGKGVKVNKVTNLTDDIKLALAAKDIRIEAPIPGKNAIGIEVPNRTSSPVMLREILRRDVFRNPTSPLTAALGLDISGNPVVTDLKKMPHGLVAGATGSGKSVCINSILVSLLYKSSPDDLKLLLVDPKMVELAPYHDVPHLLAPVITDAKQATGALKWVVQEMERRYEIFSKHRVRDIGKYNERFSTDEKPALPYMLVVIDELADLMMVSPQDVEDSICRIAQKARACGIHLLLATQRPSVDVITGLIKANIPTRIAFSVSSQTDSRTILDMGGAERLLGRGDMLFHENGAAKAIRVQGTFVSDEEIEAVVDYAKRYGEPNYAFNTETIQKAFEKEENEDELFEEACLSVAEQGTASASSLQRRFRIGYNRAARLIEIMEARGIISGAMGSKPRQVLISSEEINQLFVEENNSTGT